MKVETMLVTFVLEDDATAGEGDVWVSLYDSASVGVSVVDVRSLAVSEISDEKASKLLDGLERVEARLLVDREEYMRLKAIELQFINSQVKKETDRTRKPLGFSFYTSFLKKIKIFS